MDLGMKLLTILHLNIFKDFIEYSPPSMLIVESLSLPSRGEWLARKTSNIDVGHRRLRVVTVGDISVDDGWIVHRDERFGTAQNPAEIFHDLRVLQGQPHGFFQG